MADGREPDSDDNWQMAGNLTDSDGNKQRHTNTSDHSRATCHMLNTSSNLCTEQDITALIAPHHSDL